MKHTSKVSKARIIWILGILNAISPFSIDMYLAAFPQMAADLNTTEARVSLTVSVYFIGLAFGQLFYGPFLDRFGRKKPLAIGLTIYLLASIACIFTKNIEFLIFFRFLQAIGGCSAGVASTAMVRDFFHTSESAKVFSLLMLILGTSPLIAPSLGTFIAIYLGWKWIFITLILMVILSMITVYFFLPEGHAPDKNVSLTPKNIIKSFIEIFRNKQFRTYSLAGGFAFSGLFTYVAGSPIIFMNEFKVSSQVYGFIFAFLACGFIGINQINVLLQKHYNSKTIFKYAIYISFCIAILLEIGTLTNSLGLIGAILCLFLFLSCVGLSYPNAAALALSPFTDNAGRAAALLGFLQLGIGALTSSAVGLFNYTGSITTFSIFIVSLLCAIILLKNNSK